MYEGFIRLKNSNYFIVIFINIYTYNKYSINNDFTVLKTVIKSYQHIFKKQISSLKKKLSQHNYFAITKVLSFLTTNLANNDYLFEKLAEDQLLPILDIIFLLKIFLLLLRGLNYQFFIICSNFILNCLKKN